MTTATATTPTTVGGDAQLKLRDYQLEAVKFLREHPRAALFLDMGLG